MHAKAITGQIILYLENFNKAAKCVQNRGPVLGGCYAVARVSSPDDDRGASNDELWL
jgi:hypothetical protein